MRLYCNEDGFAHIENNLALLALASMIAFGGVFAYRFWDASHWMAGGAVAGGIVIGLGGAYLTVMGHYHTSIVTLFGAMGVAGVNGVFAMTLVERGTEGADPVAMLALAQGVPLALYAGIALSWWWSARNEEKKRKEETR